MKGLSRVTIKSFTLLICHQCLTVGDFSSILILEIYGLAIVMEHSKGVTMDHGGSNRDLVAGEWFMVKGTMRL